MAKSEGELNERQIAFCEEYIKDLNATKAAIRAGYSEKTAPEQGARLLINVKVGEYIQKLKAERSERTQISADWVLNNIKEVAERCMQKVPVMIRTDVGLVQEQDEEGNHIWQFNANGALKGLELIGKHIGFFEVDNSQKSDLKFKLTREVITKKV